MPHAQIRAESTDERCFRRIRQVLMVLDRALSTSSARERRIFLKQAASWAKLAEGDTNAVRLVVSHDDAPS